MQKFDVIWHGFGVRRSKSFIEYTLESEFSDSFFAINIHAHLEEAI
jgi:hypothetical protein